MKYHFQLGEFVVLRFSAMISTCYYLHSERYLSHQSAALLFHSHLSLTRDLYLSTERIHELPNPFTPPAPLHFCFHCIFSVNIAPIDFSLYCCSKGFEIPSDCYITLLARRACWSRGYQILACCYSDCY